MYRQEAIQRLRKFLQSEDLSAMIIPSSDPHFGEYFQEHYQVMSYISGFSGSAGTLVVTLESAALWTDSRYFLQAEKELEGSGIELMKMKMEGTPSISQWLLSELDEEAIVAIDEELYSYRDYLLLLDEISPLTATLIEDPFDDIWSDRPKLKFNRSFCISEEITGESIISKHNRITKVMGEKLPYSLIVTACDEVAWLCNLRGSDVEYNPVALSYAVVSPEKIVLFADIESIDPQSQNYLYSQNVELRDYFEFTQYLSSLSPKTIRIFSAGKITAKNYFAAMENIYQLPGVQSLIADPTIGGTIAMMKSIKNAVEIEGFKKANIQDAIAWNKIINYIRENVPNGNISEYDIACKIQEFRKECPDYIGESFEPIVSYNANGAIVHYTPTKDSSSIIGKDGFLMIDSGGQYSYGTTDTTRTIPLGDLTQEQKEDYSIVLKGMVALSMAKFPKGTRGSQLDILARGPLFNVGKMYMHGTSHGIGHYLNVHEGPQNIRMEENPVSLQPGMVLSNEPAVYIAGKYGIRHENTILVAKWIENEFGDFYQFETLTKVPIDLSCIKKELFSVDELSWLESFNNSL